jgi:hypothetical protein
MPSRPAPDKELEAWARTRAQSLGHNLGPWKNRGVAMFWREATCAKCDSSAVYYLSEKSMYGGAVDRPCDDGAYLRSRLTPSAKESEDRS